jgi:excisionase family DNA binding protein
MEKLFTMREAAELLRISERTVRALVAAESLPVVRIGRRTLVAPATLRHFAEQRERPRVVEAE